MQTHNCYVDFQERLNERLKDPKIKESFEQERHKVRLELMINELLEQTGNGKYCVGLVNVNDY